jgi:hypothetical protein
MELHPLQNAARFRRRKGFVEGGRRVRVQVVLDEPDIFGVRIDLIHQPAHDFGVVLHGTLLGHLDMPPACLWFDHDEQVARATAFVLIIHALGLTWLDRKGRLDVGMQHHRFLIQADRRILRVILLFMLPRLEFVFLSTSWMVLGEMLFTKPNSTAFCARRRTVQ